MSKATIASAPWAKEIRERGLCGAILQRLVFHRGLSTTTIVKHCGCGRSTARKHLNALVAEGHAEKQLLRGDTHYRHIGTTQSL